MSGRLYNAAWRRERKRHLQRNPLCVLCRRAGRLTAATVVDHIIPHKGEPALFWDQMNWQSLCKAHHDEKTQRDEQAARTGRPQYIKGCDADGIPLDPSHPWRQYQDREDRRIAELRRLAEGGDQGEET